MVFKLDRVIPWGRSFDEYVRMFELSPVDLRKKIVGCGDGPAAFNAALTKRGGSIVSVDPIYDLSGGEIRRRIDESYGEVMEQARKNADEFVWDQIRTVEELGHLRLAAMVEFLSDYADGLHSGRYVAGSLPDLPFEDGEFELALCSHLLFLYSEQLSADFHIRSIRELCRVAGEVRIFPLVEFGSVPSRHFAPVITTLQKEGFKASIEKVRYEFQKGGDRMLRVSGRHFK